VRFTVAGFGMGVWSLRELRRLPFDAVEIHASLVRSLDASREDAAIVRAMITMAHTLDLRVVAGGVETEPQRRFLASEGCDQLLGPIYGEPSPAGECGSVL
jgi:EAL domain-containing protein (putative c-di-GMP-specific phosphodiesterase class I)